MTETDKERLELLRENHEYDPGSFPDSVGFLLRLLDEALAEPASRDARPKEVG
jgi:hypothetical protein